MMNYPDDMIAGRRPTRKEEEDQDYYDKVSGIWEIIMYVPQVNCVWYITTEVDSEDNEIDCGELNLVKATVGQDDDGAEVSKEVLELYQGMLTTDRKYQGELYRMISNHILWDSNYDDLLSSEKIGYLP